jgi:hypothetical protein
MPTRRGFIAASALATSTFVPVKFSVAAAAPPTSPNAGKFIDAINFFNAASKSNQKADWDNLEQLLDAKVVLITIKNNQSVTGIDPVMKILRNIVSTDKEQFNPDISKIHWHSATLVTGRAVWVDTDYGHGCGPATPTAPPCANISYLFRFTSGGLIDRMYGSPD